MKIFALSPPFLVLLKRTWTHAREQANPFFSFLTRVEKVYYTTYFRLSLSLHSSFPLFSRNICFTRLPSAVFNSTVSDRKCMIITFVHSIYLCWKTTTTHVYRGLTLLANVFLVFTFLLYYYHIL